jgi:predicted aldo/keto reductase-like oxidoreductase
LPHLQFIPPLPSSVGLAQLDLVVDTLCEVTDEFVAAGRIKHVGFSTHAQPATITRAINTGKHDAPSYDALLF